MFTGIITSLGEVVAIERRGDLRIAIASDYDPQTIAIGASIACSASASRWSRSAPTRGAAAASLSMFRPRRWRAPRSAAGNSAPRSTSSARSRSATSWAAIWYSVTPMESPPSRTGRTRAILDFPVRRAAWACALYCPQGVDRCRWHLAHRQRGCGADFSVNIIPHTQAVTTLGHDRSATSSMWKSTCWRAMWRG